MVERAGCFTLICVPCLYVMVPQCVVCDCGISKIDKTKELKTAGSLMKVERCAKCSPCSILQYFWPALSDNHLKTKFWSFKSGLLRQVLLYVILIMLWIIYQFLVYIYFFFFFFLYVPVNNFSVMSRLVFLGLTSTEQGLICLAQGHNAWMPVRLKLAIPRPWVKYCTTEPLCSPVSIGCYKLVDHQWFSSFSDNMQI